MNIPSCQIGSHIVFIAGFNTNTQEVTSGAYIRIDGAVYNDNEWHYYTDSLGASILFPESKKM